jgi:predicted transcriptional regulator
MGQGASVPSLDMLFLELASAHRLRFLTELRRAPRGASQLAKLTGVSVQEGMRHLGRLQDLKLVQRRGDREYVLTPFGEAVCSTLPTCEGLLREADFVLGHGLSWLPPHLRVAPLLNTPRVRGVESENILAHEQVMAQAKEYVFRASDQIFWQPLSALGPDTPPRAWRGVYTPNVVAHARFLDLPQLTAAARPAGQGRWRVTVVPELPFMLTVTEREAALFLRDARGRLDFSELVRSSDPVFHAWALALFRHVEAQGWLAYDARRGDTPDSWRERMLEAAKRAPEGQ